MHHFPSEPEASDIRVLGVAARSTMGLVFPLVPAAPPATGGTPALPVLPATPATVPAGLRWRRRALPVWVASSAPLRGRRRRIARWHHTRWHDAGGCPVSGGVQGRRRAVHASGWWHQVCRRCHPSRRVWRGHASWWHTSGRHSRR